MKLMQHLKVRSVADGFDVIIKPGVPFCFSIYTTIFYYEIVHIQLRKLVLNLYKIDIILITLCSVVKIQLLSISV